MSQQNRREISFSDLEEVVADIQQLARSDYRTTGNHGFAEIVQHLATTNEMVVGNIVPPKLPLLMRLVMPFIKNRILNRPAQPGFQLPNQAMQDFFWSSGDVDLNEAIGNFRSSVKVYKTKGPLPVHPIFGKASAEQIHRLILSHAAMHLSFVHPQSPIND